MLKAKKETFCILGLLILGFAFFYKTIHFGFFNLDDPVHIAENSALLNFDLKGLLTNYYIGLYHPLTTLSFAFDWWLGGGEPWIFHFSNLIFHLLGTIVLFKVCSRLWPREILLSFLIALAFMLHPLKVESVAWITERKDVLSGLLLWLTLYLYLVYLEQKRLWQYILANLSFLLALAGKVSVVLFPLFLFMVDWHRGRGLKSLINKIPFFVLSLIFGLINLLEQIRTRSQMTLPEASYSDILYQLHFYFEKFLFPLDLRAWYSPGSLKFNVAGIISIALISFITILIITKYRTYKKDLIMGFFFFALFLFPNIKIMTPGDANLVNDRYMYLALAGLTFAFFPFILHLIRGWLKNGRQILSFSLSAAFVFLFVQWLFILYLQIPYWKDSITIWERTVRFEPHSKTVASKFGSALLAAERNLEAINYLEKGRGEVVDFANLGYALNRVGRSDRAEKLILKALEIYPGHSSLLNMLGVVRLGQGRVEEALNLFTTALHNLKEEVSAKERALILNHIGLANMHLQNLKAAESFFRQALALIHNDDIIIYNLGLVLIHQNRLGEAKERFMQALKVNPKRAETYSNIGLIFYKEKNFTMAREWFNRSIEVDPDCALARNNLMAMEKEIR